VTNSSLEQQALDLFGKALMDKVRDPQIHLWDETFNGSVRSTTYKKIHQKLSQNLNDEQLATLGYLMPWIVDNVIAHVLGMLQDEHKNIDVAVRVDGQVVPSLYAVSELLNWELWGEEGWITRFSKERQTDEAYFQDAVPSE